MHHHPNTHTYHDYKHIEELQHVLEYKQAE